MSDGSTKSSEYFDALEENLQKINKKQEEQENEAIEARRIEEEEKQKVTEWVLNQEANSERLTEYCNHLNEKFETKYSEYRSAFESLGVELEGIRNDYKCFGSEILQELRGMRNEIQELKDSQQVVSSLPLPADETDETIKLRSEIKRLNGMIQGLKSEIDCLKGNQQAELCSLSESFQKELDAIRGFIRRNSKNSDENDKAMIKNSPVPTETSRRSQPKPDASPIKSSIGGEWKLVKSKCVEKFCAESKIYNHEVRPENLKFVIERDIFKTFYLNQNGIWQKLKSKKTGKDEGNRWFLEKNTIISIDNDCGNGKCERIERCIIEGQLRMITTLGGFSCSRYYQKVE